MLHVQRRAQFILSILLVIKHHLYAKLENLALVIIALLLVVKMTNHVPMTGRPATATSVWTNARI